MLNDLLFGSSALFSSRTIGGAVLLAIAAFVIGYVVQIIWPKKHNPKLFGVLAALTFLGALSYTGSTSATMALVFAFASALILGMLGLLF
ncbi:MAG: hypothetical protein RL291_1769 [Pseudomonadota bacterium]|jgi:hypothetical protein